MQLSGNQKYQSARQDVNAPDLYMPIMALWTYCLLFGIALFIGQAFKPEVVYNTVSLSLGAWIFHGLTIKIILWILNIPGVPIMELMSYAGYSFVYACFVLLGRLCLGGWQAQRLWVMFNNLGTSAFQSHVTMQALRQDI